MSAAPLTAMSTMPARSSLKTTRRCVVDVELYRCTMARRAPSQALERAGDELRARLGEHLDGDIGRDQVLLDELAHEVELGLGRRREADLDLLEADPHEVLEHPQLAGGVHGLDQRLVAVAQVHAAPGWGRGERARGPGAVGDVDGGERAVLGCGCP